MVDKADEPPENILEGSIGGPIGSSRVFEDFGLEDDVEVVVPQSLNHVVLQVDFPLDVLELVDLDPQLGLPDRVTETLVRNILQLSQSGPGASLDTESLLSSSTLFRKNTSSF